LSRFGKDHREVPLQDLAGTDPFLLAFSGDGQWTGGRPGHDLLARRWARQPAL